MRRSRVGSLSAMSTSASPGPSSRTRVGGGRGVAWLVGDVGSAHAAASVRAAHTRNPAVIDMPDHGTRVVVCPAHHVPTSASGRPMPGQGKQRGQRETSVDRPPGIWKGVNVRISRVGDARRCGASGRTSSGPWVARGPGRRPSSCADPAHRRDPRWRDSVGGRFGRHTSDDLFGRGFCSVAGANCPEGSPHRPFAHCTWNRPYSPFSDGWSCCAGTVARMPSRTLRNGWGAHLDHLDLLPVPTHRQYVQPARRCLAVRRGVRGARCWASCVGRLRRRSSRCRP